MILPIIIIAIILNLLLLFSLIIVIPRLLQRTDRRASEDSLRLREMLLDILSEQEAVTVRQNQISLAVTHINGELAHIGQQTPAFVAHGELAHAVGVPQIERRVADVHAQVDTWLEQRRPVDPDIARRDTESWGHLLGLLASMQDRIAVLNNQVALQSQARAAAANDRLLNELEAEMTHLRALADEIAGLQWKLRRSVLERENSIATLRSQVLGGLPAANHRAA